MSGRARVNRAASSRNAAEGWRQFEATVRENERLRLLEALDAAEPKYPNLISRVAYRKVIEDARRSTETPREEDDA